MIRKIFTHKNIYVYIYVGIILVDCISQQTLRILKDTLVITGFRGSLVIKKHTIRIYQLQAHPKKKSVRAPWLQALRK